MKAIIVFILLCSTLTAADNIKATPNIFGGQNFTRDGRSIGHSRSSNFGGQKFYDNKGKMGHLYGNGTGSSTYRGNADFGKSKGQVLPMLGQGLRGPSGRYGQRPSNRAGSASQLRSGNTKGK